MQLDNHETMAQNIPRAAQNTCGTCNPSVASVSSRDRSRRWR